MYQVSQELSLAGIPTRRAHRSFVRDHSSSGNACGCLYDVQPMVEASKQAILTLQIDPSQERSFGKVVQNTTSSLFS